MKRAVPGSRIAHAGIALALFLAFLCLHSASAQAVSSGYIHDFEFGSGGSDAGQFQGSFSNACCPGLGVAVDSSTGDVYVADSGNARVQRFDENGNFLRMWGYGVLDGSDELQVCTASPCLPGKSGVGPGQFEQPMSIAVDNSGGPNARRVYVADWQRQLILKYSPEGAYLGQIDGSESPGGPLARLSGKSAVDVDNQGFVWVLDRTPFEQEGRILRFSNQPSNQYVGGSQFTLMYSANPLQNPQTFEPHTMDATGDGTEAFATSFDRVVKFTANGASFRIIELVGGRFGSTQPEIAVNHGNEHLVIYDEGQFQEYDAQYDKLAAPFGQGCCSTGPMAIDPVSGKLFVPSGFGGEKVVVFKPRRVPLAQTDPASDVRRTTATLHGTTEPDPVEGGEVTECYFEWGYTTSYEHKTPCEPAPPYDDLTQVTADLSGLEPDVPHHFRIAATNSVDTNHGKDEVFTPRAVVATTTEEPTEVTAASATLNGSFDADGIPTEYYFEWGKDKNNYQNFTPVADADPAPGLQAVSEPLTGLEDYTTYYYRLRATNSFGTSFGDDVSFRTAVPELPEISDTAASDVTDTAAHLSARVVPNFGETFYGFEYGETPAYGAQVLGTDLLPADDQGHSVASRIEGLMPGRTYHYRAIAINFGGISYGPDQTFTTKDVPLVLTTGVASVGQTTARLNALVSPSLSPTTVRFEYGTSPGYGGTTPEVAIGAGGAGVPVALDVGGLAPGTTHHFRAVASNAIGTATGPDQSFVTAPALQAQPPQQQRRCKRTFVRRNGKCVCPRGFVRRGGRCRKRRHVKRRRAKRRKAAQRKRRNAARAERRRAR